MIAASGAAATLLGQLETIQRFDGIFQDAAFRLAPRILLPEAGVALIEIDDKTLDTIDDPMVLWPGYFATIIQALAEAGAKVAAVDMIPSVSLEKYAPQLDQSLIKALAAARSAGTRVIYGYKVGQIGKQAPHRKFSLMSSGLGFVNLYPGFDSVNREYAPCFAAGEKRVSASMAMLTSFFMSSNISSLWEYSGHGKMCSNESGKFLIDYRFILPEDKFISFSDVVAMSRDGDREKLASLFSGKAVFIGVTSARLPDIHRVPINHYEPGQTHIAGVFIHMQAYLTQTTPGAIKKAWFGAAPAAAACLAMALAAIFILLPPSRAMWAAAAALTAGAAVAFAMFLRGVALPFWPLVAATLAAIPICGPYLYLTEFKQRRQVSRYFKSYVSQEALEAILRSPDAIDFTGSSVTATVMFADIRGFTSMSEKLPPGQVVDGLNEYFTQMTGAITEAGGYVNKYLGDGILAIFGAPAPARLDGALDAVIGAQLMLKRLTWLNENRPLPGFGPIKIGIGLHCGEAIMGNIGCRQKMDYSIIGDTVNTASRVESLTKLYGVQFLMTESVYDRVKDSVEAVFAGSSEVKGKEKKLQLYSLKGMTPREEE